MMKYFEVSKDEAYYSAKNNDFLSVFLLPSRGGELISI